MKDSFDEKFKVGDYINYPIFIGWVPQKDNPSLMNEIYTTSGALQIKYISRESFLGVDDQGQEALYSKRIDRWQLATPPPTTESSKRNAMEDENIDDAVMGQTKTKFRITDISLALGNDGKPSIVIDGYIGYSAS